MLCFVWLLSTLAPSSSAQDWADRHKQAAPTSVMQIRRHVTQASAFVMGCDFHFDFRLSGADSTAFPDEGKDRRHSILQNGRVIAEHIQAAIIGMQL